MKKGVLVLNKSDIMAFWGMLLMLFCSLSTSLSYIIVPSVRIRTMMLIIGCILLAMSQNRECNYKIPVFVIAILLIMILFIIMGYFRVRDYEIEAQLRFVVLFSMILVLSRDNRWHRFFFSCAIIFGSCYIITTIWLWVDKELYFKWFANSLYPIEKRFYDWANRGYTAGITDHISTNGMALANVSIIVFCFFVVSYRKTKKAREYGLLLFFAISAIFLTGKRAHLLFTLIALFIGLFLYYRHSRGRYFKYLVTGFGFAGIMSTLYLYIDQVNNVIGRFFFINSDMNVNARYTFWKAAISAFKRQPLLGVGWFGFRNVVAKTVLYSGHAHNIYIQLLCENGLLGTIVFFVWFIYSLLISIGLINQVSVNKKNVSIIVQVSILYSFTYQCYFLMYGITGNPLYDVYQYPYYLVACSIALFYRFYGIPVQKEKSN